MWNKTSKLIHSTPLQGKAHTLKTFKYFPILYHSYLKPFDWVYHSALRFISGDPHSNHHCTLCKKSGKSSVVQRRDKHLYLYMYTVEPLLDFYHPMLDWTIGPYQTHSANCLMLQVPRVYSYAGKSAFSFCAPNAWNNGQHIAKINTQHPGQTMIFKHFTSVLVLYCQKCWVCMSFIKDNVYLGNSYLCMYKATLI